MGVRGIANLHNGSLGGDILALFAWYKCVGSHDLWIWRLRNLAAGFTGFDKVFFLSFGERGVIDASFSGFVSTGFFFLASTRFLLVRAPRFLSAFALSNRNFWCGVGFRRREVTVGVLSSLIFTLAAPNQLPPMQKIAHSTARVTHLLRCPGSQPFRHSFHIMTCGSSP